VIGSDKLRLNMSLSQSGTMNVVEQNLANWKESLLSSIPTGGLLSRNPVAYKWKAAFRVWMLREAVFWRLHDLMTQSYALHQQRHGLGARILLRSGFESLATLIYLNQLMQQVLNGKLSFHAFGKNLGVAARLAGWFDRASVHQHRDDPSEMRQALSRHREALCHPFRKCPPEF
jgi:hypothetical protein